VSAVSHLTYPGLKWLTVTVVIAARQVHARIEHAGYSDEFAMHEDAIGAGGEKLLKEAYLRRAKLMAVAKIAKELEK
jgi:hypothetical protein